MPSDSDIQFATVLASTPRLLEILPGGILTVDLATRVQIYRKAEMRACPSKLGAHRPRLGHGVLGAAGRVSLRA
jgi:hypothetical protein